MCWVGSPRSQAFIPEPVMMRQIAWVSLAALVLCLGVGGCAMPPGVDVTNKTGEVLNVEYMVVKGDGSTTTYSKGVVSKGSNVTYKVDVSGSDGVRVRFSLPDAPVDDATSVLLKVPNNQTRYYDLEYISGRLVAREFKTTRSRDVGRDIE